MLRLRTFGGAALLDDDRPLEGSAVQRRRLALLSILAVAGDRGLSRDKVGALLWPDSDQERARHSLSQWLFTTRRDLRTDDLFCGTAELRLNPERISTDVGEFEEALQRNDAEAAVACYGGPFLDGFHLSGASEFERWLDGERSRLAQRYQQALESLAGQRASAGDHRGALDAWRRLAAADPYNARVALALMRTQAAAGDVAGALAHARVHGALLREELGAEPHPDVTAYAEQLRVAPPAAPVPAAEPHATQPPGVAEQGSPAALLTEVPSLAATAMFPAPAPAAQADGPPAPPPPAPSTGDESDRARPPGRRRRVARAFAIGTPLLLVLATAAFFSLVPADKRELVRTLRGRDPAEIRSRRIVVAPLEDLTRDTSLASLGFMASDWITQGLTHTGDFEVVDARTSDFTSQVVDRIPRLFRPNDAAIALAEETGAGLLISGRYYRHGDSILVQVKMTDVGNRKVLAALPQPIAGSRQDLQRLVDAVTRRVVAMAATRVDTSAAGRGIAQTRPPSYAAYREARAAWESYYAQDTAEFFRRVRRAAAMDPDYMLPLALEAHVRADARQWATVDSLVRVMESHPERSELERAAGEMFAAAVRGDLTAQLRSGLAVMRAAPASVETRTNLARLSVNANLPRQALQLLSEVDQTRGLSLVVPWYWNWATAAHHLLGNHAAELQEAERGLRRFPRSPTTVANQGRALAVLGRGDAIHELLDRLPSATSADGNRRWKIAIEWARELRAHGHPGEARRLLTTIWGQLERTPMDADGVERYRATVLSELEQWPAARAAWQRLAARDPSSLEAQGRLAVASIGAGDVEAARAIDAAIARWPDPYLHGRDRMWRARIATALGERARAIDLVEQAFARGYPRFFDPTGGPYDEPEVHADPALQPLRGDPAFRSVIAPKG